VKRFLCGLLVCSAFLIPFPAGAQVPPGAPATAQRPAPSGLNLQNADIRAFIQDVARATGHTFIIDPRVQGTVTIYNNGPLANDELLEVLLSTLRANGLIAVPAGRNAFRIVPDEGAVQQPGVASGMSGGFTTEVYRLQSSDASSVADMIKPLVGRQGIVLASPQGNTIVVADYADNLRRVRDLIAQVDRDTSAVQTITVQNTSPQEAIAVVERLLAAQTPGGRSRVTLAPAGSSNSIVVRGDPALVRQALSIIADIDQRAAGSDDVRVIRLRHASAEKLLPVLQQIVGQTPTQLPAAGGGDGAQPAAAPVPAPLPAFYPGGRQAKIALFGGANALVISADVDTQRLLENVIRELDVRREQVLVEAIVVEVSDGAAEQLGVQFLLAGDGSNTPFFATNYTNSAASLLALTGAVKGDQILPPNSSALEALRNTAVASLAGVNGALLGGLGNSNGTLFGAIVNAVKSDTASNLLSTPSILTLDNESASLLVGQEIPVTTGEVLGAANANPFRTIRRQDVGIQLDVKPQINAGGAITLLISQEVSSVAGPVSATFNELVLNKRKITTTVLVDDGEIIVLGGLLDQNERTSVEKVPGLGDIPLLGALFRNNGIQHDKRNLMVFIRPTIVRNPQDAYGITAPRYDLMRKQQVGAEGRSSLEDAIGTPRAPASSPPSAPATSSAAPP